MRRRPKPNSVELEFLDDVLVKELEHKTLFVEQPEKLLRGLPEHEVIGAPWAERTHAQFECGSEFKLDDRQPRLADAELLVAHYAVQKVERERCADATPVHQPHRRRASDGTEV